MIKGDTCAYLGLLGVACSPILSVSLEEVGCEPVLNLAVEASVLPLSQYTCIGRVVACSDQQKNDFLRFH